MTNLIVESGRARTDGRAPIKWYGLKARFEGRVSLAKDGSISFVASPHNVSIWREAFPDCVIKDVAAETKVFEQFIITDRPKFQFKRPPLWWQEKATEKQRKIIDSKTMYNAFAFFFDPGAGKSKSLTDFATLLYCEGKIDGLVVLPPNVLVGEQWTNADSGALVRDIHESVDFKSWLWDRSLKKGHVQEYENLLGFQGFKCIVANIDAIKTERGFDYIKRFIKACNGRVLFAIDEAHLISKPSSGRHKKALELGSKCDWRAALTGSPINKSLMSAYGIFKFLDERILGYKYATSFRNVFCETRWNGFADQIVGHKNVDKFYQLIEPYSQRVSQAEMGLEKFPDEFEFDMSDEQSKHFQKFKKEWMTALDNGEFATASIAMTALMKMQQITNGFLVGKDGTIQHIDNARLRALDAWLETIDEDQKLVVWCRFLEDAKILMKHFGDKAVEMTGNVTTEEKTANKYRFIREPEITRAVATPDAAGTGMDGLQDVCNRAIYYSTSEHFINRIQSENRILRVGGGSTAFITDLICRKSPDRKIVRTLKSNKDLAKMTLDDVRMIFE